MLLVGFRGTEATQKSHIVTDILSQGIGGVILFDMDKPSKTYTRNIVSKEQVCRLISGLQSNSKIPLFVAIDQEGGSVSRLKPAAGFPALPSAKVMSKLTDDSLTVLAYNCALSLRDAGINLNLAPVVDLNIDPASKIIGALGRSFGSDTSTVIRCASIFLEAHYQSGVLSTLKHFPGHGSGHGDTHEGIVDVTRTWKNIELVPFRSLINSGLVNAVMTNHVFNAKLDRNYPATLSTATINGVLRQDLSWQGVVITDDLQMDAIRKKYSLKEALELSIKAGADILLLGNNCFAPYDSCLTKKAMSILLSLVETGKISPARIDSSWNRIMSMKKALLPIHDERIPVRLLCINSDPSSFLFNKYRTNGRIEIYNFTAGPDQAHNYALLDSLRKSWRPDAITVPYPAYAFRNIPPFINRLINNLQKLPHEATRPVIFGIMHSTADTANNRILLDKYYKKNQISSILRLVPVSSWDKLSIALNFSGENHSANSEPVYQLIPFAAQNFGRLSDVTTLLKANMKKSGKTGTYSKKSNIKISRKAN